jgi:hypothetical protein
MPPPTNGFLPEPVIGAERQQLPNRALERSRYPFRTQEYSAAVIVSQSTTYNAGVITVSVVLSTAAGMSAWLTQGAVPGGKIIGNVMDSLTPEVSHSFRFSVGRSAGARVVLVNLEVVNA